MKRIYVFTNAGAHLNATRILLSPSLPQREGGFPSLSLCLYSGSSTRLSFHLSWLPCYLNGRPLIASFGSTALSSLLLCNECGIRRLAAENYPTLCVATRKPRPYESLLDRATRNFIPIHVGGPTDKTNARGVSPRDDARSRAHTLTSITTDLSPRSEELRHHIVVALVSAATSTLP